MISPLSVPVAGKAVLKTKITFRQLLTQHQQKYSTGMARPGRRPCYHSLPFPHAQGMSRWTGSWNAILDPRRWFATVNEISQRSVTIRWDGLLFGSYGHFGAIRWLQWGIYAWPKLRDPSGRTRRDPWWFLTCCWRWCRYFQIRCMCTVKSHYFLQFQWLSWCKDEQGYCFSKS